MDADTDSDERIPNSSRLSSRVSALKDENLEAARFNNFVGLHRLGKVPFKLLL